MYLQDEINLKPLIQFCVYLEIVAKRHINVMLNSTFYKVMVSPNQNGVTSGIPQIMMCLYSLTLILP